MIQKIAAPMSSMSNGRLRASRMIHSGRVSISTRPARGMGALFGMGAVVGRRDRPFKRQDSPVPGASEPQYINAEAQRRREGRFEEADIAASSIESN
jgi:hypothetical protein